MELTSKQMEQQRAAKVDRVMLAVITLLVIISLALAPLYDTWLISLMVGLPVLVFALYVTNQFAGSVLTRNSLAIMSMVMVALQIHQAHGMLEIHFGVFVLLALFSTYLDIKPLLAGAATIAVHHLVFGLLQASNGSVWVFPNPENAIMMFLIHAVYVIFETGFLIYFVMLSRREKYTADELLVISDGLSMSNQHIDLKLRCDDQNIEALSNFNRALSALDETIGQVKDVSRKLLQVS